MVKRFLIKFKNSETKNNNLISTLLFLHKKLIIHLHCHDFAIIKVIVLLDIQQTAAAVSHLSNVMTIHGTTYVRKNGKDIFLLVWDG